MAGEQSPEFKQAVEDMNSNKLKATPSAGELLKLYGRFKHGTHEDITDKKKNPPPGVWDFKGKEKRKAWQEVVDTLSPEQAQKEYVETVEQLKEKYGFDG